MAFRPGPRNVPRNNPAVVGRLIRPGQVSGGISAPPTPNLAAWWDLSQLNGVADGASLAGLTDLSTAGRNAVLSSGSTMPTFARSVSAFGGLHGLSTSGLQRFDLAGPSLVLGACAVFCVLDRPTLGDNLWALCGGTTNGLLLLSDGNVFSPFHHFAYSLAGPQLARWFRDSISDPWVFRGTGMSADVAFSASEASFTADGLLHRNQVGGDVGGNGIFGEWRIFDHPLSSGDRTNEENYLSAKWGVSA